VTAAGWLLADAAHSQGFTTITSPVVVPLHWRHLDGDPAKPRKLGIYATLGGGTTPQLFEFDTGGDGFYATWSANAGLSPWWGGGWTATGGTFSQTYDSGMTYSGSAVTTTVNLFQDASASVPLLSAGSAVVGRTDAIVRQRTDGTTDHLWPRADASPPVDGVFWGDFGMAPKRGQVGIDSLPAQLLYGSGMIAGFRVHAADESPWVQFGLTAADVSPQTATYVLAVASGSSAAGVPYYQNVVASGSISVTSGTDVFTAPTGFIFDTGASTTIHNTGTGPFPSSLVTAGRVVSLATFVAGGTNAFTGQPVPFLDFRTGDTVNVNQVGVQQDKPEYYLNTGILPFTLADVVYDLGGQTLTLVSVPEPSGTAFALAAIGAAVWLGLRPHRQPRRRRHHRVTRLR